jgi:hypothetical protein
MPRTPKVNLPMLLRTGFEVVRVRDKPMEPEADPEDTLNDLRARVKKVEKQLVAALKRKRSGK